MKTRTIGQLLESAVHLRPDKPYLYFEDQVYTYRQLDEQANRAANALLALGVQRGDRVAVVLPNCPAFLFLWLGLMKTGGILVAMNPEATEPEVAGLLAQSDPRLAVADPARAGLVRAVARQLPRPIPVLGAQELLAGAATPPPDQGVSPDDVAVFIHTSGTTGQPKLVMQPHRGYVLAAEGFPWWLGLTEQDRLMAALPLFHLNAQVYSTLGSLAAGASLVLLPRFSASRFWDQARRHGATEFNAIGAMVEILMRQPERTDDADHPVRLCYTAPAPSKERQLEIERRFGLRLTFGYALSESPYGTIWPLEGPRPYGSMGRPRQHPTLGRINDARIVDEQGREVGPGEVGELLLRNPATMAGYFRMPEETARVLRDGWLHTGDLVRADEAGWLYFVARKKEVIRRRGENLAPAEVEAVLSAHPDVVESAVIGVPSELSEEEVKAFVVPKPERSVSPETLRAWCADRLAPFKVPRYLEFVAELPMTSTGRIAKHLLPRERTPSEHDLETVRRA